MRMVRTKKHEKRLWLFVANLADKLIRRNYLCQLRVKLTSWFGWRLRRTDWLRCILVWPLTSDDANGLGWAAFMWWICTELYRVIPKALGAFVIKAFWDPIFSYMQRRSNWGANIGHQVIQGRILRRTISRGKDTSFKSSRENTVL